MTAIFKREFKSCFTGMIGWVIAAVSLFFLGLYFTNRNLLYASSDFASVLYTMTMILLFLLPAISMRSFAEERKNKTDQLLLTSPVSIPAIVAGKFLAELAVFALPLAAAVVMPLLLQAFGTVSLVAAYSALLECFEKVKARLDARSAVQETAPKAYYDQIVYDVQQYLKDNYRTATLEEAAAKVSLSPAYLSRVFKEKSGTSFSELLLKTRMEKACEMLADIHYKSYDIAYYVGYDNPKNFSRAFKAYYGQSPSEYRKSRLDGAAL